VVFATRANWAKPLPADAMTIKAAANTRILQNRILNGYTAIRWLQAGFLIRAD
jgi:hypothetical protein